MSIYIKIINQEEFERLTGKPTKKEIVQVDQKVATILIRKGFAELAELQREIESPPEETIPAEVSPETIKLLQQKDLLHILVKEVQKKAVGEENSIMTMIIVISLAKVAEKHSASSNLCLNAQSGTGKDFIAENVLNLIPARFIFKRRRISERALDYALAQNQNRDWSNYIIYLEDVNNKVLNSDSVKTLLTASPNKENIVTVIQEGKPLNLKIFGKPIFIFTTAKSQPKEETLRRIPFCFLDESPNQTRRIAQEQARLAKTGETQEPDEKIKDFFNALQKVSVLIPFADMIAQKLTEKWINQSRYQVILRTIFPRFLDYIKASAALHQYQREKNQNGCIIATKEDYENARLALLTTTSNALMIPLTRDSKELLQRMTAAFPEGASISEIAAKIPKWGDRWLRQKLDELAEQGFIDIHLKPTENSFKPVSFYQARTDVFNFTVPTFEELQEQNTDAIKTIDSNPANNSINAVDSNNAINSIDAITTQKESNCTNCTVNSTPEIIIPADLCAHCKKEKATEELLNGKRLCKNCHEKLTQQGGI